jgi:cell division septum initiation protein DivIVA
VTEPAATGLPREQDRLQEVLDRLTRTVREARAMPMSASCVVHRGEVLELLEELSAGLPRALGQARDVLAERDEVVADGRREAARLVEAARAEREELLRGTEVQQAAHAEAARTLAEAEEQARARRLEAEQYVDGQLATFEVVLARTLETVGRGRRELNGTHDLDALGTVDPDELPLPG